jgi:tetratricopeptide (TPR) repeat protein
MAELSPTASWVRSTLAGMPGAPDIVPFALIAAVVADAANPQDVMGELLAAGLAVRVDMAPDCYQFERFAPALGLDDDLTGYATVLWWYAIETAKADRTLHPDGDRHGLVYERVTELFDTPTAAVAWFQENLARLSQMLTGGMNYGLSNATCELAEPFEALASSIGEYRFAFNAVFIADMALRTVEDRRDQRRARATARLAHSLSSMGHHEEAVAAADRAVELATNLGPVQTIAFAHAVRGRAHQFNTNLAAALVDYTTALTILEQGSDPALPLRHLRIVPDLAVVAGATSTLTHLRTTEQLMVGIGDALWLNIEGKVHNPGLIALLKLHLASVQAAVGDTATAITHLRSAEHLVEETGDATTRALVIACLARTLLDQGQHTEALATIEPAFDLLKTPRGNLHLAEAAAVAGEIAEHTDPAQARAYYILAISTFDLHSQRTRAAEVRHQLDKLDHAHDR